MKYLLVSLLLGVVHAQNYAPLTTEQLKTVSSWVIDELTHAENNLCWKDSYGNGFGKPMGCAPGMSQEGLLCYSKCPSGFFNTPSAGWCYQSCPEGFRDDGLFCAKPAAYGRGVGRGCPWDFWGARCGPCNADEERNGLMCYPKCRPNFHSVGCCICSPDCPSGWNDIGVSCTKPSIGREIKPLSTCPNGLMKDPTGLLCYPQCRSGFYMVGPVCWKTCPADQPFDCAASCAKNRDACALATIDMVFTPLTMLANLFSAGSVGKIAKLREIVTDTYKLTSAIVDRLQNVQQQASTGKKPGLTLQTLITDPSLQTLLIAIEESVHVKMGATLSAAYGSNNALVIERQVATSMLIHMVQKSLLDYGISIAQDLDPIGVVNTIKAFAHPICRDRQSPPSIPLEPISSGDTLPPPVPALPEPVPVPTSIATTTEITPVPTTSSELPTVSPAKTTYVRGGRVCNHVNGCTTCNPWEELIGNQCYEYCKEGFSPLGCCLCAYDGSTSSHPRNPKGTFTAATIENPIIPEERNVNGGYIVGINMMVMGITMTIVLLM